MNKKIINNIEDKYNEDTLKIFYKIHKEYVEKIISASTILNIKVRSPIMPEHISENIIKMVLKKYLKMDTCSWNCKGDLSYEGNKIECKTFTSNGPLSFGPNEAWDYIYFYDAREWLKDKHIIYKLSVKNTDPIFQNIKINKTETFNEQAKMDRRPRIIFEEFKTQLGDKLIKIFEGKFEEIF